VAYKYSFDCRMMGGISCSPSSASCVLNINRIADGLVLSTESEGYRYRRAPVMHPVPSKPFHPHSPIAANRNDGFVSCNWS
jgi:hypothetical protein